MAIRDTSGLNEDGKEQDRSVLMQARKLVQKKKISMQLIDTLQTTNMS